MPAPAVAADPGSHGMFPAHENEREDCPRYQAGDFGIRAEIQAQHQSGRRKPEHEAYQHQRHGSEGCKVIKTDPLRGASDMHGQKSRYRLQHADVAGFPAVDGFYMDLRYD